MAEILSFSPKDDGAPATVLWKVRPGRPKNTDVRDREHLTPDEVTSLLHAAGKIGRHRHRDRTLILIAYRHGLRVSELVSLKWESINFKAGQIHITRLKAGNPATHYLEGDELRALRKLQRQYPKSRFVFVTERKGPLTRYSVNKIVARAGDLAEIGFPVHPHMLRHACGFALANKGVDTRTIQDYLGHRNIQHTVRYTQLAPERFRGLWD